MGEHRDDSDMRDDGSPLLMRPMEDRRNQPSLVGKAVNDDGKDQVQGTQDDNKGS